MRNPALSYLLTLGSAGSRKTMRRVLDRIARLHGHTIDTYPWASVTTNMVLETLAMLEEQGLSYRTVNVALSALKGVAKQAWREELLDGDTLERIKDIENRRGSRLPAGAALDVPEVDALLQAADSLNTETARMRARVVLLLGFDAGLRRSEIGSLRQSDVDLKNSVIRVKGKGNKEREVPLSQRLYEALSQWMQHLQLIQDAGFRGEHLLGSLKKNGELGKLDGISGEAVRKHLRQLAITAGIPENRIPSPHDMRRTAVTNWLERGSVRVAQALAGHEHVQTTMNYDRGDLEEEKRKEGERWRPVDAVAAATEKGALQVHRSRHCRAADRGGG